VQVKSFPICFPIIMKDRHVFWPQVP